ncbi:hypothetical protein SSX86_029635 [Deinandra increscens subsp. villosa]|uniref:Ubiquitin-like protease family profile domain-containing protein n=1 Tax=Deinandra increscens subsp. villosa TaxID=3103831 RepID=A0AAP0CAV3_9ASTR
MDGKGAMAGSSVSKNDKHRVEVDESSKRVSQSSEDVSSPVNISEQSLCLVNYDPGTSNNIISLESPDVQLTTKPLKRKKASPVFKSMSSPEDPYTMTLKTFKGKLKCTSDNIILVDSPDVQVTTKPVKRKKASPVFKSMSSPEDPYTMTLKTFKGKLKLDTAAPKSHNSSKPEETNSKGMKVAHNQNAITFWTKANQTRRQKFEMKNDGFGKGKYKGLSDVVDNGSSGIHELSVGETLSDNVSEVQKNFQIIQSAKENLDNSLDRLIHMFPQSVEARSLKERYDSFFKSNMIWTEEDFVVADIPVQSDRNENEDDDTENEDDMENDDDTERSEEADDTEDVDDIENEVEDHMENQADDTEVEDHDENDFDDDDGDHRNEDANDVSNEEADVNKDGNDVENEEGHYNDEVDDDDTEEGDSSEEMNDDDKEVRDVNDVDNEETYDIEDGNDVHNEQGNDNEHVVFTSHGNQSSSNIAHDATHATDVGSKVYLVQQKSVISQSPTEDDPGCSPHVNLSSSPPILDGNNFGDDPSSSHHLNLNSSPPNLEGKIMASKCSRAQDETNNESWEETYVVSPRNLFPKEDVATTSDIPNSMDEGDLSKSIVPYTPLHTPTSEGEVLVAMEVQPISAVPTLEKVQEVAEQLNSKRINPFRQPSLSTALRSPYFDRGVILETPFTKEEKQLWDVIMKDPPPTPQNMGKNVAKNKAKIPLNSDLVYYSATHVEAEKEIMQSLNYDKILNTRVLDAFVDDEWTIYVTSFNLNEKMEKVMTYLYGFFKSHNINPELKGVDMVFFPIEDADVYYIIVFELKCPAISVIDSFPENKPLINLIDDDSYFNKDSAYGMKYIFACYLENIHHPKAQKILHCQIQRVKIHWATKACSIENPIFAMRHMEKYMGRNEIFYCDFGTHGNTEKAQLKKLRKKYLAPIILSDANLVKQKMKFLLNG